MIIGNIFNSTTTKVLKKGIEGTNQRHEAIANNIANVDTPHYQRATVSFEDQLKRIISGQGIIGRRTTEAHFIIGGPQEIDQIRPRVDIDNFTRFRADKNNINIDQEMADMALNTQRNLQFTELLTRRYSGMKKVITTPTQ
ncbi:flagellar basal body rod protein FlgB [bacterium]|nr:flagellar basal body rod protein FlgB [bacterium]